MRGDQLWEPSADRRERANLTRFLRAAGHTDYDALWRWSVQDVEGFWTLVWDHFEVPGGYERVLGRREMPGTEWFPGAQVNYAEQILAGKASDAVALVHAREDVAPAEVTWGELREQVERCAAGLRGLGVGRGDRVAAFLPNVPETIVAFLATASLGAIWSSCAPEFGVRSVIDRFAQIEPKVLLAVESYRYGGRDFDQRAKLAELAQALPTVEHTVRLGPEWDALLDTRAPLDPVRVPFDHPLWVLYSSGTTGLPKAIVHGHGGILLEHLKQLHLHVDAQADDRVFWFTTTGWMMWNFLVGVLLTDATVVLYDGSPAGDRLWALAEATGVTTFGTSAAFLDAARKEDADPRARFDLSAVRAVGSTGSPLSPEGFRWVYDALGPDVWLFSTSGGTDVCTAFVGGVPLLPSTRASCRGRALGASVEAWDEDGRPLVGRVGELVLTQPMPSMPVFLWNDPDGERYRESYFEMWPGVWRHGDWIEITDRGNAVIFGRSDSTINRGGVRMGTSEIYRAVLALEEITDALVVDLDDYMPLFVVLREGAVLDNELIGRIAKRVREDCSPRHVPDEVVAVREVPRTLSGKVLEVPVKRILQGVAPERAAARDSLANPAALDFFVEFSRSR
jgi:acetoacetyl-CoA synthetase